MATAAASPSDNESTATLVNLPTDTLVEIQLRLPPSSRRWVCLVCRHWRAVIDERTPPPSKPAVLACFTSTTSASAYVVDDLATGACRQVWGVSADPDAVARDWRQGINVTMVGTCNGLLCLCDNTKPGGAISLLNPATGETPLRLPPLPVSGHQGGRYTDYGRGETYGFGFHPRTGRYTVLHLPCEADVTGGFTSLQVFTLGHPSLAWAWRDVPVCFPGGGAVAATCRVDAGLVTVDGATHWVTKDAARVASFDHGDERVALAAPLPVVGGPGSGHVLRLTEVRGRLGLAVRADRRGPAKTDVWVLGRQGWNRQYSVQVQAAEVWQRLAGPHFAHGGYVLAVSANEYSRKHLYAHRIRDGGEVRSLRIREEGTLVAYCKDGYHLRTFAYVETTEPLPSVFKRTATKLSS